MIVDTAALYNTLYHLAADHTEGTLFGTCAPLAFEAFQRSKAGGIMPLVWFEVPLTGAQRFDLHVAYDNEALHQEAPFAPEAADDHGALLNWYAAEPREGAGLALAYDVGDGRIDAPAIHVNVRDARSFDAQGFFAHVDRADAAALFEGFVERLPHGWSIWYFGVHPGRPGAPVRMDCFVERNLQQSYAANPAKLEEDLAKVGFTAVSAQALRIGAKIASSPFAIELQFDVHASGELGPTIGISANFAIVPANAARPEWEPDGNAARLMQFAEELGVADSRWQHVTDALFTTGVRSGDKMLGLYCVPTFAKFRVRSGKPLDTKIYLQANARML